MSLSGHDKGLTIDASGWIGEAARRPSPYCDARPDGVVVDLIVVHGISLPPGCFGGGAIDDLFCGRIDAEADPRLSALAGMRVSAHLLVRRDGALAQYVALDRRAWHAGVSEFDGRRACNDFSIGIELEGTDETPYEDEQYERLGQLCRALMRRYPAITPERIVGHSDIAPGRKTDPGPAFDWSRLRALLPRPGRPTPC